MGLGFGMLPTVQCLSGALCVQAELAMRGHANCNSTTFGLVSADFCLSDPCVPSRISTQPAQLMRFNFIPPGNRHSKGHGVHDITYHPGLLVQVIRRSLSSLHLVAEILERLASSR